MDNKKDPGIAIESINLIESHIEMLNPNGDSRYSLELTNLHRHERENDGNLLVLASFDLMSGIEKPIMRFQCTFIAQYSRAIPESMSWSDFTSAMALAHIYPFLREYVNNMTNRLPVPALMLDPVNVHAMIARYQKRNQQTEASAPKTINTPTTQE